MFVLGLQGSPRKKGNTEYLLSRFMEAAEGHGARTHTLDVCKANIEPCKEFTTCEKRGICPIKDEMESDVYTLLRRADVVLCASPVFFYNVTAQLKALIDRSQTLWARRYRLKLLDPKHGTRRGFSLSVGATKGKQLFTGVDLTVKYFFDAVDAEYAGNLYYWRVEHRGDMEQHPTVHDDIAQAVATLLAPFKNRKRVLFVGDGGDGASLMAGAFAEKHGGAFLDVETAEVNPGVAVPPEAEKAMAEKGIDIGFLTPRSVSDVARAYEPEIVVDLGGTLAAADFPDATLLRWEMPKSDDANSLRNALEARVVEWIDTVKPV